MTSRAARSPVRTAPSKYPWLESGDVCSPAKNISMLGLADEPDVARVLPGQVGGVAATNPWVLSPVIDLRPTKEALTKAGKVRSTTTLDLLDHVSSWCARVPRRE